ncbi:MAG: Smr/MutS family protein [Treponema sp.]|nr:Smr/MutS family protein [Treponema sp.]
MNKKTLTELDYYKIRDAIATYCVSDETKALLATHGPLTDAQQIAYSKQLGQEWTRYIQSPRQPALSAWPEIHSLIPILRVQDAVLAQEQLYALALFCRSVQKIREHILAAEQDLALTALAQLVQTLPDLQQPQQQIGRIIDTNGALKDLPELRAIKNTIASIKRDITALMHKYTSDTSIASALESTLPVYRADRQLLAVKSGHKNSIKGIVHEVSQSGQTVYIEPEDVVRKNNDLIQEEFHLQQEIRHIFQTVTAQLHENVTLFKTALPIMEQLDKTCAIAKWGVEHNCVFALPCQQSDTPQNDEPPLILQARHPLLGDKAVPVDIPFITGKRILIITGPNTGGKTVTLKTIALFAMMNQSGFPIPAAEGTRLPLFSSIFADIGDEQSLDQSLSTFSGHMKNIATAVRHADKNSLVLLDELGSGTDPQEGSAIAMAVLDTLIKYGSFVLVTTHHGILKNYGYTHPACINASVEFNEDTLSPTYRLVMGVPGESRALEIANRSGLPRAIVTKARSYLTNEQADISKLINGLTAKHAELDVLKKEFDQQQKELRNQQRSADLKDLKLKQKELELKKHGQKQAERFLSESRKQLENLVRSLKEGEVTHEKAVSVKQYINDLTQAVDDHDTAIEAEEQEIIQTQQEIEKQLTAEKLHKKPQHKIPKKRLKTADALAAATPFAPVETEAQVPLVFKEGAEVLVGASRNHGILLSKQKNNYWNVQLGSMKMTIREKDMTLIPTTAIPSTPQITIDLVKSDDVDIIDSDFPGNKPLFELRLLGLRCEQAIKVLQHQLDLCTMHNFHEFSIIHGKGNGILQQAVQDYLSHYPGIAEFKFATPEDGGTGKTYVKML